MALRVDRGTKENCLQLVMLWQARHNTEAQHMTIDTKWSDGRRRANSS